MYTYRASCNFSSLTENIMCCHAIFISYIASICMTMHVQLTNICIYSRKYLPVYFRELPIKHDKSCFFWHAEKKTMISPVAIKFFCSSRILGHLICFLHQETKFSTQIERWQNKNPVDYSIMKKVYYESIPRGGKAFSMPSILPMMMTLL